MASGQVVRTIVYDTGALLAAERCNPDFLALHDELIIARIRPIVLVVVLAQAWRGGQQHQISRVLKGCDLLATAVQHQAAVVTSDPDDLTHLTDSIGVKLRLFTI